MNYFPVDNLAYDDTNGTTDSAPTGSTIDVHDITYADERSNQAPVDLETSYTPGPKKRKIG